MKYIKKSDKFYKEFNSMIKGWGDLSKKIDVILDKIDSYQNITLEEALLILWLEDQKTFFKIDLEGFISLCSVKGHESFTYETWVAIVKDYLFVYTNDFTNE